MQCCYWYQCYHLWAGGGILLIFFRWRFKYEYSSQISVRNNKKCSSQDDSTVLLVIHTYILEHYQQRCVSGELWRKWMQNTIFSSFIQAHTSVLELKHIAELICDVFAYLTIFYMCGLSILHFCITGAANTLRNCWCLCRKTHWFGKCFLFFDQLISWWCGLVQKVVEGS